MGENMTLEDVRDFHKRVSAVAALDVRRLDVMRKHGAMADAIDAHLATPAQTVDIEAVREVIAQLKDFGFAETKDMDKWSDKLAQAIGDKT